MDGLIHVIYAVGDNGHVEHVYIGVDEKEAKEGLRKAMDDWRGQCDIFYDKWAMGKKISSEGY